MIAAVVVTYNPDLDKLKKLLDSISNQVSKIYLVNNGSLFDLSYVDYAVEIDVIQLEVNKGIGFAQNIGVQNSFNEGFVNTLLLDQDSTLKPLTVDSLLKGFVDKSVAAVGPSVLDTRNKRLFKYFTYKRFSRSDSLLSEPYADVFYETDLLISSGTIVNNEIFIEHQNNEELFIEYVDVEWCLRLRESGYKILFSDSVIMEHELGDSRESFLGLEFPLHQPGRYYFVVRNACYCSRNSKFPLYFRIYNLFRCLVLIALVLVKSPKKRLAILKNCFSGFVGTFKLNRLKK